MQYQVDIERGVDADINAGDSIGIAVIDDVARDDDHTTVVFTIVEPFASMFDQAVESMFVDHFRASMEEFGDLKPDGYEITRLDGDDEAGSDDADVIDLG
jgi:hypothetical protein